MDYKLVSVRIYNGVEDGKHAWTVLSCAIVIPTEGLKAVCLRDRNIEYEFLARIPDTNAFDHSGLKVGDIRVFLASDSAFERIKNKNKHTLERYMQTSDLFFGGDTQYGKRLVPDNNKPKQKTFGSLFKR